MPRSTLTVRAVVVTCVVAVVSVLVTAAVAIPLSIRTANREVQQRLSEETALAADAMRPRIASKRSADEVALADRLRSRNIDVYLIREGEPDRKGLPELVVTMIASGKPVGVRRAIVNGKVKLIAGRPLPNRSGVVLAEDPANVSFLAVLDRLWLALLAGLAAGFLAGPLLARRVARPIRETARAAGRLSAGDRSVRIETRGPAEVDDLAAAFNDLATALALSEGREREFLLSVSHELRTPLTTIKGYAEALADGVVGPDGAQRAGKTVLDEAERLDRLIADLLVLARLEAADLPWRCTRRTSAPSRPSRCVTAAPASPTTTSRSRSNGARSPSGTAESGMSEVALASRSPPGSSGGWVGRSRPATHRRVAPASGSACRQFFDCPARDDKSR